MIDERGRPQPELCTVLAGGVHDAEIVLAVAEQHVLLALRELGDASHQILDLVVSFPARRRHRVEAEHTRMHARTAGRTKQLHTASPGFRRHDFSPVLLRGVTITGQNLKPAVGGKHPQIHKDLSGKGWTAVTHPSVVGRGNKAPASSVTCCLKSFS